MSEPYILTENLSKTFEAPAGIIEAVKKVDLEVEPGEFISVTGPTGSGKTTLLNLIAGLTTPSEGRIFIDGRYLGSLNHRELSRFRGEKIGFIFQFASLIPSLTVLENVALPGLLVKNESKEAILKRAGELLSLVGMAAKEKSLPAELSGGEQRRAAIVRALINQPQLILADEPTGDLDEETEVKVIDLLHQLNREKRATFVLVTHNSALAARGDRLFEMSKGVLTARKTARKKK